MKRKVSSHDSVRKLKRAGSSLFSISTTVEDQDSAQIEYSPRMRPSSIGSRLELVQIGEDAKGYDHKLKDKVVSAASRHARTVSGGSSLMATTNADSDISTSDDFFIDDSEDESYGNSQEENGTISGFIPASSVCGSKRKPLKALDGKQTVVESDDVSTQETNCVIPSIQPISNFASPRDIFSEAAPVTLKDNKTGVFFEAGEKHFDRHNAFNKERPLRVTSVRNSLSRSSHNFENRCIYFGESQEGSEVSFLNDDDYLRTHLPGYMQR